MGGDYQAKSRHSGNRIRRRNGAAYSFELTQMHEIRKAVHTLRQQHNLDCESQSTL